MVVKGCIKQANCDYSSSWLSFYISLLSSLWLVLLHCHYDDNDKQHYTVQCNVQSFINSVHTRT